MSDKKFNWEEAVEWLRGQVDKRQLVHDCYYDDPLLQAAERFSESGEWRSILGLLKDYLPGKVLDVGAGRGVSSYAFAKAGCEVTALEPDPSTIVGAQAIQSLVYCAQRPIRIVQEYGESLPFGDNEFDIVYGRAVFHHAQDLLAFCREARRVLRKGGVFVVTREHVISKKEDLRAFLDGHPLHHLYGGEMAYLLTDYIDAIKGAGLTLQKVLGPMESEINYSPMTLEEHGVVLRNMLAGRVGEKVAYCLEGFGSVRRFLGWYLSRKSNAPGRLYSFVAVKK